MKSVLTRVTELEKKYMKRKAEENDVEPPEEEPEPEPQQNPSAVARAWMTNM
jgi:hypothetical protein